jgi:hypothetical protein
VHILYAVHGTRSRIVRTAFAVVMTAAFASVTLARAAGVEVATPARGAAYLERLEPLRAIGGWVYYPTFVPARFALTAVESRPEKHSPDRSYRDYSLTFCDKKHRCFYIRSAGLNGGIGDAGVGKDIRPLHGTSRLFGQFTVWARGDGSYLSDWLEDPAMAASRKNHVPLARVTGRFHDLYAKGVTDQEAVAIVQSLTPLRRGVATVER